MGCENLGDSADGMDDKRFAKVGGNLSLLLKDRELYRKLRASQTVESGLTYCYNLRIRRSTAQVIEQFGSSLPCIPGMNSHRVEEPRLQ